jgi:tRNA(His) 5'-end guanylyltransferase
MGLIEDMDDTTAYLCKNIQGAKFAFVQSDEISVLLTDFDNLNTSAWFDGNIQKIASIAASMVTAEFNRLRMVRIINESINVDGGIVSIRPYLSDLMKIKPAMFDARVFSIPSKTEVGNYFLWRQNDCTRNSIQSVAQSLYSHRELMNKNTNEMQELIFQKGQNWNDYDAKLKRGRFIDKVEYNNVIPDDKGTVAKRTKWKSTECPIFSQDWEFLYSRIPDNI